MKSFPVIIVHNNNVYPSTMEVNKGFEIYLEHVLLETPELYQHWEIEENYYDEKGNFYNFDLTGDDNEITNFKLVLTAALYFSESANYLTPINLVISILYKGNNLHFSIRCRELSVSGEGKYLENAFIDFNEKLKKELLIKCCYNCKLAGYEKGGSAMICYKKHKTKILEDPKNHNYQNRYGGLRGEFTYEFNTCDAFVS